MDLLSLLQGAFAPLSVELLDVCRRKVRNDRIDALTALVGGVYRDSHIGYVDGELSWYDGSCWVSVSDRELMSVTRSVLSGMGVSPTDLRTMGAMALDWVCGCRMVSDRSLVGFSNGVLDLRTGALEGFSPERVVTSLLPWAYDASARCPGWDAFVEWAVPEEGERMALQEFVGLAYVDRRVLAVEKFAVLIGSGANGKSVFTRVVSAALGEGNVSTLDPQQLTSEKMVPYLKGKRLNCSPDVRASSAFDSALKALSSGQSVTGRRIYGDAEEVECPPIIFALNEMPFFRDQSPGFFRRLMVFRFVNTCAPGDQDRTLASRLIATEMPGIVNWILRGMRRLVAHGGEFTPSESMESALAEVRSGGAVRSPLLDWLEDNGLSVYPSENSVRVSANRVFDEMHGLMSKNAVTREMSRLGVECRRSGDGMHYNLFEKTS